MIVLILGAITIIQAAVIALLLDKLYARRESRRLAERARRAAGFGWLSERKSQ